MALITYEQFRAGVTDLHLELMGTFMQGTRAQYHEVNDAAALAAARAACIDFMTYELTNRVAEGYEVKSDGHWRTFDVYLLDVARGYFIRLIKEGRAALQAQ